MDRHSNHSFHNQNNLHVSEQYQQDSQNTASGSHCQFCGHQVHESADVCEACGRWLREGYCCFCYSPYKEGQKFCAECGNPPQGILCPSCGNHTIFDICPACNYPLSKRAKPALEKLREELPLKEAVELLKEDSEKLDGEQNPDKKRLDQLNNYAKEPVIKKEAKRDKMDTNHTPNSSSFAELIARRQDALRKKLLELQRRTFQDNQSARLFYEAVKPEIMKYVNGDGIFGWKCEYSNTVHYKGPSGCQCPSMGGRWVCKSEVQLLGPGEFILEGIHFSPGNENPLNAQHKNV